MPRYILLKELDYHDHDNQSPFKQAAGHQISVRKSTKSVYYSRFGKGRSNIGNHDQPLKFTESSPV